MGQDTGERFFLIVVDDTEELHQALFCLWPCQKYRRAHCDGLCHPTC